MTLRGFVGLTVVCVCFWVGVVKIAFTVWEWLR